MRDSFFEQFVFVVIDFRLGVAVFVVLPSVSEQFVLVVSAFFFVKFFQNGTQAIRPLSNFFFSHVQRRSVKNQEFRNSIRFFDLKVDSNFKSQFVKEQSRFRLLNILNDHRGWSILAFAPNGAGLCCPPVLRPRQVVSKALLGAELFYEDH